ncbi:MAG: YHYH protein [Opitutus sp.]|nr:YHYH protein [Opitutus sp.]
MKKLICVLSLGFTRLAWAHSGHETIPVAGRPATPSEVKITVEGDRRIIRANGMPDHPTGPFPGRNNPNSLSPQKYEFRVSAKPQRAERPTPNGMNLFGIAVNGVVFDPAAAEWWNDDRASGWQYDAMSGGRNLGVDFEHAHVQPTGAYHYHGMPESLVARLTAGQARMALVGWAADGFPIYGPWIPSVAADANSPIKRAASSYRVKTVARTGGPGGKPDGKFVQDWEFVPGAGDLDECNGRTGPTPEFPGGTYYYVLTEEFPFIPRLWRGTPDASFIRRGPPPGGGPDGGKGKRQKRAP